jgi:hypothetical protein
MSSFVGRSRSIITAMLVASLGWSAAVSCSVGELASLSAEANFVARHAARSCHSPVAAAAGLGVSAVVDDADDLLEPLGFSGIGVFIAVDHAINPLTGSGNYSSLLSTSLLWQGTRLNC